MNEPGFASADPLRALNGFVDREMGGVRRSGAKAVEGEHVHTFEQFHRGGGHAVGVGDVGEIADAISEDRPVSVRDRDGDDLHALMNEGLLDLVQLELGFSSPQLRVVPDVSERAPHSFRRHRVRERMHRLVLPEVEGADVIESQQMIRMRMREQQEVEAWDGMTQELHAKVWCRVDQKVLAVVLDGYGLPEADVFRSEEHTSELQSPC